MTDIAIAKLADYALAIGLVSECERTWAINTILDVLKLDSYNEPERTWDPADIALAPVLEELLDNAHARGVLAENSVVYRDLFDTELMGRLTPRPAQVIDKFQALYAQSPRAATDWYYEFSQDTNYIRRDRIAKDVKWKAPTEYGGLDITINLSKPEKDPKAIAAAKNRLSPVPAVRRERGLRRPGEPPCPAEGGAGRCGRLPGQRGRPTGQRADRQARRLGRGFRT